MEEYDSPKIVEPTRQPPTNTEIVEYHNAVIMQDKSYYKQYKINNPLAEEPHTIEDISIIFRTRADSEATQVAAYIEREDSSPMMQIKRISDANLAFSLVQFGEVEYDKGTLDERLERINKFQAHKKGLLWDYLNEFDAHAEEIRELHKNF